MLNESGETAGGGASPAARTGLPRLTRSEWVLLLVLATVQFTLVVDFVILVPLGPKLEDALKVSAHQFGWVVSAYGFAASATGLLAAVLLDRFDRKRSLLVLFAGFALGTLLCALAPDFLVLLVGRAVAGGFAGVMGANVLTIVSDVFPESRRATAMGVVMSAYSVANIVGIYAGLEVAEWLGWWGPFAVLAGLCVPALALAAYVLPPLRRHLGRGHARPDTPAQVLRHLRDVISRPNHLRAYALTTALMLSSWTIIPYLAIYIVHNVGRPESDLRYVWLCGGVGTLVTMTPTGWLADSRDKLLVFRVIGVFCLLPLVLITNIPEGASLWLTLGVTTLFMVATSIRWVPLMAMITASAAPHQRGSFMSVNSSVQQAVMGVAPVLSGFIIGEDADGPGAPLHGFRWVGAVAAAAMVASVVLAGRLRRAKDPAIAEGSGLGFAAHEPPG
ncbi:MAG TPA: MFS transporter [Gemmataceae bacterium]|nr:MFS transporter [Gemmataceae bacterium]